MKKQLLTSLTIALFTFGIIGMAQALPIENDVQEKNDNSGDFNYTVEKVNNTTNFKTENYLPDPDNFVVEQNQQNTVATADLDLWVSEFGNGSTPHHKGRPGNRGGEQPVPEPATMLLFGIGLAGLVGYRLKRKQK